ncbi:hypothetical protein [Moraxella oblonga]|uniref:hypothetical protein n=1 Tax=Moraxella oblonga TaxID=200413 RepID=UPI000834B784|nr:hypothetical protein [Moraxella oblonga]
MRFLLIMGFLINGMVFSTTWANEVNRLDFIYFKPINQAQRTDFDNPVNVIKYHGIYDTTYTPIYTGLFKPYEPSDEWVLTLADNHESLTIRYGDNTAGKFANANITPLENGDYIVSYEKVPLKPNQSPLIIKHYIKTFDISGEFLRTEVNDKPATLFTSFTNYHALPKILHFPKGSKCYQWRFHESTPEFYEFFRRVSFELFNLDNNMLEYLSDRTPSEYLGENNQVAIYSLEDKTAMLTDYELTFYFDTIHQNKYYSDGIKFTPKNAMPIDGKSCTYLNPIASDYIESLLKTHQDEIIKKD